MADEIKKIIEIDTGNSISSLKEYKKHIDDLRGSLLTLDESSEEYANIAKEIKEEQDKLNSVMKVGKGYTDAADGSYNQLVQTMADLKKQWRATGDEAERDALGKQILEVNDKLKTLDASTGNFQRNVGNYENAFTSAFGKVKDSIASSVPAVGKLNTAFKTLAMNPVGAVITAIALAIGAVVKAMKGSESQFNRFKVATSGIKVVVDGVKNAISAVADAFVTLTEKANQLVIKILTKLKSGLEAIGWDKMANNIGNVLTKMEEYADLEQRTVDISAKRRQINVAIARTENEVADLRAKIGEKTKYSEEERLKFIEQWEAAEKRRAQLAVSLAQEEYNIIKERNALTESSTKDLDAENDAYVNLIKAQGQYSEALRTINKQKETILNEINSKEKADDKEKEESLKRQQEEEKKLLEEKLKRFEAERNTNIETAEKGAEQAEFDVEYDLEVISEEEKSKKIYEINRKLIEDKITIQEEYLKSVLGNTDLELEAAQTLSDYKQELANLDKKRAKEVQEYETEQAETAKKNKIAAYMAAASSIGSIFGSLSELFEEGSEEQKTFAIMEATINTIAGAVGAFMQASSTYPPPYGQIVGGLAAAAATASGIAQIAKIKSTTKNNTGTLSSETSEVAAPSLESVGVNPLLNEQSDIQQMTTLSETGDSFGRQQNVKVYVTESDISDATHKAEVRDSNATF